MNKKKMRNHMLSILNNMNLYEYNQLSFSIKENLFATTEFKNANVIGITLSRFPEVDTRLMIEAAWTLGKKIAVPKCQSETREMDFRIIESFDSLETVYMDLLEPIVSETTSAPKEEIDLQIVPGVIYSEEGFRIGFGGGYYDRYLMGYSGNTLSLAFECQTKQYVPKEDHDIPIEKIITEKGIFNCRKGESSK